MEKIILFLIGIMISVIVYFIYKLIWCKKGNYKIRKYNNYKSFDEDIKEYEAKRMNDSEQKFFKDRKISYKKDGDSIMLSDGVTIYSTDL